VRFANTLDAILGRRFAVANSELVANRKFEDMVCLKAGKLAAACLDEALKTMKCIDPSSEIVHAAGAAGATFRDSA
jgi:ATP-dependent phosphofructokinase / diphosphate-dependent phosphofructokinase